MNEKIELTDGEKMHQAWLKVDRYLEQRLVLLRSQLEGDLTHDKSQFVRGQIREVLNVRALADERPRIQI